MTAAHRTLTQSLARHFAPATRRRGEHYFLHGRVRLAQTGPLEVHASVRGSRHYDVHLETNPHGSELRIGCTCPAFANNIACKHVWATLLAAEQQGHLRILATMGSSTLTAAHSHEPPPPPSRAPIDPDDADWGDETPTAADPYGLGPRWMPAPASAAAWKLAITEIQRMQAEGVRIETAEELTQQILYVIDMPQTLAQERPALRVLVRRQKRSGGWTQPKPRKLSTKTIAHLTPEGDRILLARLIGSDTPYLRSARESGADIYLPSDPLLAELLPAACDTGRLYLQPVGAPLVGPLQRELTDPYQVELGVELEPGGRHYRLRGHLASGSRRESLSSPTLALKAGWVVWPDRIAPLQQDATFAWITMLRATGDLRVPRRLGEDLIRRLLATTVVPPLTLPPELHYETVPIAPQPVLSIRRPPWWQQHNRDRLLWGSLRFAYGEHEITAGDPASAILLSQPLRAIPRDRETERLAADRLTALGLTAVHEPDSHDTTSGHGWEFAAADLPRVVASLLPEHWKVHAEGKVYRNASASSLRVVSGLDWFELQGAVEFDGHRVALPALLAALRHGTPTVPLGDGTIGLLPQEWLERCAAIAALGEAGDDDSIRFSPSQAGLLDALLAAQPQSTCDAAFDRIRQELRDFSRIAPADPEPGFLGQLRPYQREGLGWLHFLRRFGFGGCLADDMGLGKTVQVLALLQTRRRRQCAVDDTPLPRLPTLVVAPRSLLFNWEREAGRFCPDLRVLVHSGGDRTCDAARFADIDLVLTTYGTLRRDIAALKDIAFDYVILDESQFVKNAGTAGAKAVRLLKGRHRLALSGTPIENHLGELWSLFEFLNPGLLGAATVFQARGRSQVLGEETRTLLARALRPFILRRTKGEVARDLPAKTEETVYCELEPVQRKLYNDLRNYYRSTLLQRVERDGLGRAKIQVLEALLRLRQAACHPGLLDPERNGDDSAKLDLLIPQLRELVQEGHKALVFSQFTRFLGIVRERLNAEHLPFEYLDGRTRDRQERVDHFQNDPACQIFLISLKAGGVGLNLTAAEYVFILDPWWNPAVEAQAIDRTHRIGQVQPVFAYRLIARDTVEERVLELQQTKRGLADAIINADNSLIRDLRPEDLQLLLG